MWLSSLLVFVVAGTLQGVSSVPFPHPYPFGEGRTLQPKISYSRETVAKPGEDVTIDCGVEGIDLSGVAEFNVAWSKIDLEKPTNSYPITNGDTVVLFSSKYSVLHPKDTYQYSLKIVNIDEEDTGTYRCTVNFGDNQKINAEVPVIIEKAPYFVDPNTKTLTVSEGDAISIDCRPGGSPTPTVFWERVNHELPFYGGNFFKDNQLDIPFVDVSHGGRYVCHADNGVGEPAKSEVVLSVQYEPKVSLSQRVVGVTIHDEVEVQCRVDASPAAEVVWFRGDDPILGSVNLKVVETYEPREGDQHDEILADSKTGLLVSTVKIARAGVDELGEYKCRATNAVGETTEMLQLKLKSPPRIIRQSVGRVFYTDEVILGRDNLPVELTCLASGVPSPQYRWTRNNVPLPWQTEPRYSLEPNTGTLLIEDPTVDDNGWYQCLAHNELGVAKADPVYLLNATRVSFDIHAEPFLDLTAEEGRPFSMPCPNVTGDPKPTLTWAIASNITGHGRTQMQFFSSNRTVVAPDGTAYFTHVTKEDDSRANGITYLCLGVNSASPQDFSLGTTVKLTVVKPNDGIYNGALDNLNIEPFLMYSSPSQTLARGARENKLWCIFGGEPEPVIMWDRLDGRPLSPPDYAFDNYNSTLVIHNTDLTHAGDYQCIASNGVGPMSIRNISLSVDMPPTFRQEMKSSTVEAGSTVVFECDAEGSGILTYSWYFNGREIRPNLDGSSSSAMAGSRRTVVGNRLNIAFATTTDTGNYACNATSISGYAYGQATLIVLPSDSATTSGGPVCPEVTALRSELSSVRDSLTRLREFVQTTRTAQADASISLMQRIAAKLNILTQEEQDLLAAQEYIALTQQQALETKTTQIVAELQEQANNRDQVPNVLYAEQKKNSNRNEPVNEEEEGMEGEATAGEEGIEGEATAGEEGGDKKSEGEAEKGEDGGAMKDKKGEAEKGGEMALQKDDDGGESEAEKDGEKGEAEKDGEKGEAEKDGEKGEAEKDGEKGEAEKEKEGKPEEETKAEGEKGADKGGEEDEKSPTEGDNKTEEEDNKTEEGDKKTEEEDKKTEEGDSKTEEEDKKTEEGDSKTEEEDKKTEEGDKKTEEGDKKTEEGDKKTEEEDKKTEEGDKKTEEGDKKTEEEDNKTEEGDKKTEEDDKKTEEGDKKTEEEDKKTEEEDKKTEEGDKKTEEEDKKTEEGDKGEAEEEEKARVRDAAVGQRRAKL